ncbi:MAG: RIP metalloprotease RseP [bacterium]|nr:RIP metalloprotease RseP [bacterium]
MWTVVLFIVVLGVIVLVHELGHFTAARRFGMKVEEFGLGFPPRIGGIRRKGTLYSLNWIPVGGFVKIKGEDGSQTSENDSFASRPIWQRGIVLAAGVIMNIVLAFVLLTVGFSIGLPTVVDESLPAESIRELKVQILGVEPGTPAAEADLQLGDEIVAIDGEEVTSVAQVQDLNSDRVNEEVSLTISRFGDEIEKNITLADLDGSGNGKMGVSLAETGVVSYPWYQSIWLGFKSTFNLLWAIILAFYTIIKGLFVGQPIPADLSGPVGIAVMTGQVAQLGFVYLMQFTAVLSLNLAILNFIPFPALDGGRFLFLVIEKIKGSKINQRTEALIHNIGFAVLMILVLLVTFRDIGKFSDSITGFFKGLF